MKDHSSSRQDGTAKVELRDCQEGWNTDEGIREAADAWINKQRSK